MKWLFNEEALKTATNYYVKFVLQLEMKYAKRCFVKHLCPLSQHFY